MLLNRKPNPTKDFDPKTLSPVSQSLSLEPPAALGSGFAQPSVGCVLTAYSANLRPLLHN